MINKLIGYIGIICLLFLGSCIDEIDFEIEEEVIKKTVIQGSVIAGEPSVISVSVGKSADFITANNGSPIVDAEVLIRDKNGASLIINPSESGKYEAEWVNDAAFSIETGKSYQLSVTLRSGEEYLSTFEPLISVPKVTQVDVVFETRQELNEEENIVQVPYVEFLVHTPLRPAPDQPKTYLKWDLEGNYRFKEIPAAIPFESKTCFYFEKMSLGKVLTISELDLNQEYLSQYFVMDTRANHRFANGFYLTVIQQSLSRKAYEYWNMVKQVSERTGSIFEAPPGKIISNIHNENDPEEEILGYFYLTQTDTLRRLIKPADAGSPREFCFGKVRMEGDRDTTSCEDCLRFPSSTITQPEWWIE